MAKRIQAVSKLLGNAKPPVPAARSFTNESSSEQLIDAGKATFEADPSDVMLPKTYNREEISYTDSDDAFKELRESIEKDGQDEPIHVRKNGDDLILISGRRRLEACRALGRKIICIISTGVANEKEAELEKYRENTIRKNLSAYELWQLWQSWLDNGIFESKTAIAKAIGKTRARVSQVFSLTKIPAFIVKEIDDKRLIQTRYASQYLKLKAAHGNLDHTLRKRIKDYQGKIASGSKIFDEKKLSIIFAPIRTEEIEQKIIAPRTDQVLCVVKLNNNRPTFHLQVQLSDEAVSRIEKIIVEDAVNPS
ncbi:ParB/RepB/Spo0J family partition protein, partial [Thiolapillus sp.]|uniref:ParB/RepB/Spo0J family partition protein n=2 Tax=Thiolapillus sp. TaxID=2017437 RepID=UPI003AF661D0